MKTQENRKYAAKMTGRGTNVGKKRHSSQPLGGNAKDARGEADPELELGAAAQIADLPVDQSSTWSLVTARGRAGLQTSNRFGLLAQSNSFPDKSMRSGSISSRGSRSSRRGGPSDRSQPFQVGHGRDTVENQEPGQELKYSESSLGAASRFVTPPPDGAYRDDFAIEFQELNGKPFKGTITLKEARDTIFKGILGFNPNLLHSIRPVFGGTPTIRFKLKEQIYLDDLSSVEYFDLERKVSYSRTDIISCRIMGIRGIQATPNYDGTSNDVRWVKIENCEYQIGDEEITRWMKLYGQPLSLLGEDVLPDSDSDGGPLGNGTYSIKMKLTKDIPQFLPMHGRKIRVYFKNMNKLCTNCYGSHSRRQCTNERTPWVVYVRDFMKNNPDITQDYYGKWWEVVDNEFPGYFDDDSNDDPQVNQQRAAQIQVPSTSTSRETVSNNKSSFIQRRQSRDPRLTKQDTKNDEITSLLNRGLSLKDAKDYVRNKKEQDQLEKMMKEWGSFQDISDQQSQRGLFRSNTNIGPGSSRGGRGGLSFN